VIDVDFTDTDSQKSYLNRLSSEPLNFQFSTLEYSLRVF
jgi:hypothetical protein